MNDFIEPIKANDFTKQSFTEKMSEIIDFP